MMATNRKRRPHYQQAANGLTEGAYYFFGNGPYFDGQSFEEETTPEERADIWKEHRETICARWRLENPQHHDLLTWGELLKKKEAAGYARE
jgi:hypothetical protein